MKQFISVLLSGGPADGREVQSPVSNVTEQCSASQVQLVAQNYYHIDEHGVAHKYTLAPGEDSAVAIYAGVSS